MGDHPTDRQSFGRLWLNRGIAAARAGKRAEAREALFRALNDESQREMAWLWLAAVADDARQERMYLEKVLSLNPDNRYAQAGLARLKEKAREGPGAAGERSAQAPPASNAPTGAESSPPPVSSRSEVSRYGQTATDTGVKARSTEQTRPAQPKEPQTEAQQPRSTAQAAPSQQPKQAAPVAGSKSRQQGPATGLPAAAEPEPTGWTTDWPVAAPPRQGRPQASGERRSAEWVGDWRDDLFAPQQPRLRPRPAPRRRRLSSAPPDTLIGGHGRVALIVNEAFTSHEMWTILASALSLVLLAFVLAFFFALSLLTP